MAKDQLPYHELARAARVSVATVSRVANGSSHVSPELRNRVIKTAAKLGVDLSQACRPKANVIAFLLCNRGVLHSFHSHILAGAEAYCASQDYGVLFLSLTYSPEVRWKDIHLPAILRRHDVVRAAMVAGTNSQNLFAQLTHQGMPFVVLGNNVLGEWNSDEYNTVYFDDIEGAREVTRYLLALGHRNVWFAGNLRLPWFTRRYEGYRQIMEEAGLTPRLSEFQSNDEDDVGYLAVKSILQNNGKVSAIFAGGDTVARGAYRALRDKGLRIPSDVAVVGFNDTEASILHPALTTVRAFPEQVGARLAEVLLEVMARPELAPKQCTIPTQLVKRESCGPCAHVHEDGEDRNQESIQAAP